MYGTFYLCRKKASFLVGRHRRIWGEMKNIKTAFLIPAPDPDKRGKAPEGSDGANSY